MPTLALLLAAALPGVAPPPREAPMNTPTFALVSPDGQEVFLAADDLAEYDWARHRLTLGPGVKQRLLRQLAGDLATGRPFVVVADGRRCYEGVFTSSFSSKCFDGVVIDLASAEDIEADLELQLGYPTPRFFRGADPRGDPAVLAALRRLNRLR